MTKGTIALWMYKNDGGDRIQHALKDKLEEKGYKIINDFDMRDCYYFENKILTKCGQNLLDIDLLYHMNADEQTLHQNEILHALDQLSIPVVNHWDAFSKSKDKFLTNLRLKKHGILTPPSALVSTSMIASVIHQIFYSWKTVLFKPRSNHGGKGIVKFERVDQFLDFTQTMNPYLNNYYLEKFIPFGAHDYRVEIIDGKVVGGYCRTKVHAFKTNVSSGGLMTGIMPDDDCKDIAIKAAHVMGIETTIVDMLRSNEDGKIYVLEVNPILGIFVEAGIKAGEKSVVTDIHPVFANDEIKLNYLSNYLDWMATASLTIKKQAASTGA